jgi:four helix bundle protein
MLLKNFRTYHLAKEFYKDCEKINCKPHMKDQLNRASLSIVNNLAEGSAKPTAKDRARIYAMALGSFRECQGMLDLLEAQDLLQKYDFLGICLFNLHRFTLNPRRQAPRT